MLIHDEVVVVTPKDLKIKRLSGPWEDTIIGWILVLMADEKAILIEGIVERKGRTTVHGK